MRQRESLKEAAKGGVGSETLFRSAHTLSSPLASWRKWHIPWPVLLEVCPFVIPSPRAGDTLHFYGRWTTVTMAKAAAQLGPRSVHWPDLHLSPHHIHYTSQGPSASGTAGSTWWYSAGKEWTGQWAISSRNSQHSTQLPTNALILAASLSIALAHAQKGRIS